MQYIWWKDFLDPDTLSLAQQVALENKHRFVDTTVSTGEVGYRKSTVLWHYHFIPLYNKFTAKIREYLPYMQQELGVPFDLHSMEVQLTASNDGEYFKTHTDNGSADTASRRLTFVYYFLLSDYRRFTGGELRLRFANKEVSIDPQHNSIVIFPSGTWHEVMPVSVPTGAFEHSRLTLNGWCRGQ